MVLTATPPSTHASRSRHEHVTSTLLLAPSLPSLSDFLLLPSLSHFLFWDVFFYFFSFPHVRELDCFT